MRRTLIFLAALAALILAGCNSKDFAPIPNAQVSFSYDEPEPYVIRFTNTSTPSLDAYIWWFGQGANAVQDNRPTHRYTGAGDYTVKLQCKDSHGFEYYGEQTITVKGK